VSVLAAASGPTTLWFLTRATGVVALLLLTSAVMLGVLSSVRWRTGRLPRFLVGGLHRNVTLLAVAFVGVHVVTTVADGYAPVGLRDALIPFVSPYRPLWLGLGAVAFDLLLALVLTSLLRVRLGYRTWRAVHWLAYASWPIALVHALGTGSDARYGWLALVGFGSLALVAAAVLLRTGLSTAAGGRRAAAAAGALVLPLALFLWYDRGPGQTGWAARAGTPTGLLHRPTRIASRAASQPRSAASLPAGRFDARLDGHVTNSQRRSDGLVTVNITGRLRGGVRGNLRLTLWGLPTDGGGVAMTASNVALAATGTMSAYSGNVVSLDGNRVEAHLRNGAGAHAELALKLQLDPSSHAVSGLVQGRAVS
jgi:DMSO/TMAO reductase YedYZ heme-binding membrane subunit